MSRKTGSFVLLGSVFAGAVLWTGCSRSPSPVEVGSSSSANQTKSSDAKPDGEHPHKPGAHGGIIVEIGRDNYHAEAVFEKGGILRLYTLGQDEAKVFEVESQTLTAYVKLEGSTESESFILKPAPQNGDSAGKTSQFIGHLPRELWGQKVEVTIPSVTIAGERFRVGFASTTGGHEMPAAVSADEEKKLYLSPGGKYTEADIKANGNVTASQKFKGFKARHDLKPKPGEKICPVTLTKANPECTWIVDGKVYEFCCPPCVDEFVQFAKEQPDDIKGPSHYVKKK